MVLSTPNEQFFSFIRREQVPYFEMIMSALY